MNKVVKGFSNICELSWMKGTVGILVMVSDYKAANNSTLTPPKFVKVIHHKAPLQKTMYAYLVKTA